MARTSLRRRVADRAARALVSAGGFAIIASILGILVFILAETLPLFFSAEVRPGATVALASAPPGGVAAAIGDEYRTRWLALELDGRLVEGATSDPKDRREHPMPGPPLGALRAAVLLGGGRGFAAATPDGKIVAIPARFDVGFVGSERRVTAVVDAPIEAALDPSKGSTGAFAATLGEGGKGMFAAQLASGALAVALREVKVNELTEEKSERWDHFELPAPRDLTALVIDQELRNLYGGTSGGQLVWWDLARGRDVAPATFPAGSPITALSFLLGDRSLVVGQESGALGIWFPVERRPGVWDLARIREYPSHPGPIRAIAAARRDKSFLAQDATGMLGLYHSTSHRVLWTGPSPARAARSLFYSPKGDGALLAGEAELASVEIRNPHPEFSFSALFGPVWYEGRPRPEHTWQSTGGTDDWEPKLGLTPLLWGTLKGTFYSLLLAIPVAVLAAMYTSQFLNPGLRRAVKPVVEIMAALPSVVLGFLAGLWLAPKLERHFPALLLGLPMIPLSILAAGWLSRLLPERLRRRFPEGAEVVPFVGVLALALGGALALSRPFEAAVFGGHFGDWLLATTGLRYDQRNALVVGIAMGFAVIPIIFAISEDAFSNVPRNLVSGSLALGANRWQTVVRVVLPTASPGVFSAIMVGFGRAVGETMIVLMATGNTPYMTASPFDGFRTLSANIATEIPEAAHGSTHFRTLYLSALLLFGVTFLLNTAAEAIRQRLRRKYASL